MSSSYQERASSIVNEFKSGLPSAVAEQLTASDEDRLVQAIVSAMADEVDTVVGKVDELARELRSRMTRPELGL